MRRLLPAVPLPLLLFLLAAPALAELEVNRPPEGSVSEAEGLAAFDRIYAVAAHPRCANCHVDEAGIPMWTVEGETRPHGMNIHGGESRTGAEALPCRTCHVTDAGPNDHPHAPPHAGMDWQLAPAGMLWFGQGPREICLQLRDPDRNGGRDLAGLVEHVTHDAEVGGFITWGFAPGAGRDPAPGTMQSHLDDILVWGVAGMPCPE